MLKPIWTCGIQLWATVANCNVEMLPKYQSKVFRIITNAFWYVINDLLYRDLKITIKETIKEPSVKDIATD